MAKEFKDIAASVTDEDFKTFMGENVDKFTITKQRMLDGKKTSWDWIVFLLAIPWVINYRYNAALNGFLVFFSFCLVALFWDAGGAIVGSIFALVFAALFALKFKMGYVKSAYKKIHKIKNKYSERDEQLSEIEKAGKTFKVLTWQNAAILALFLAYSAYQISLDTELQQMISVFLSGTNE